MDFSGKRITVMGLGRFSGGVGVVRYLAARGAKVTVTDSADADTLRDSVAALAGVPVEFSLGGHHVRDFVGVDAIVVGPGVPKESPFLAVARAAGTPLTAEMNLFLAECQGRVAAITGSNGKSTTTAMAGAVLDRKYKTWVGGNIGRSLLDCVDQIGPSDRVALEMSSFQLEDLAPSKLSPALAMVTNLTPNHLDRHGSMAEYGEAKKNIFRFQKAGDWLILNRDDPVTAAWHAERKGRLAWFGLREPVGEPGDAAVWSDGSTAKVRIDGSTVSVPLKLRLPGKHNVANALASLLVGVLEGVEPRDAAAALAEYRGLPDRLEFVADVGGVRWFNDSIATTPESVLAALDSFEGGRICIVGGHNKNLDLSGLAKALATKAKAVITLGRAADEIETLLRRETRGVAGPVMIRAQDMDDAVRRCASQAAPGDVVLMSPACASFDMFTNYRHRGEVFKECVRRLASARAPHAA